MGNLVDKNLEKNRSLPFDPPNSAAALHQFLSQFPPDRGVKLESAFTAPVIKVRTGKAQKLDSASRKAWSFHLLNMQERLVGTKHDQSARDAIESLLKKDDLKISVDNLLSTLERLMPAEQARLAGANSYVKRWLANEKTVLQTAVPHDPSGDYQEKENQERDALLTATSILLKFSNCENGDIDGKKIRDEAYTIGHHLTKGELDALGSARLSLMSNKDKLESYIGPEVPLLMGLCIAAFGKSIAEFNSDASIKNDVFNLVNTLKARSDNNEYLVHTPRGTSAKRSERRKSMPVFLQPETTATSVPTASSSSSTPTRRTPEKEGAEARTTPPQKSLPATPERGSPGNDQSGQFTPVPSSASTSSTSAARGGNVVPALNMGAAIAELRTRQNFKPGTPIGSELADLAQTSPSGTPRESLPPSSKAGAGSTTNSNRGSTRSPRTPTGRTRLDMERQPDAITLRQKSDGSEMSTQRDRKTKSSERRVKSMVSLSTDPADQDAMSTAGNAARALKENLIRPQTDSVVYKGWEAAVQHLGDVLTPEMRSAVGQLMTYCHKVDLEPGKERTSLDKVIETLRPTVKARNAWVAVRDILLAESRGKASTNALLAFPELLSLLVFAIDAERAWRQDHAAKASH
jgi:hypothetical protein